jgi:hypothetical protein
MRMSLCFFHTRFQNRSHSDDSRGFTASLIYAALSGLAVVWVLMKYVFNCYWSIVNVDFV